MALLTGVLVTVAVAGAALARAGHVTHRSSTGLGAIFEDVAVVRQAVVLSHGSSLSHEELCLTATKFQVGEVLVWARCGTGIEESSGMLGCPKDWTWEAYKTAGICRQNDGSGNWGCADGWEQALPDGGCQKVGGSVTFRDASGMELCATRPEHERRPGDPLVLDVCRPRYTLQRVAGNVCPHGSTTGDVARFCPQEGPAPKAGSTLFCFMGVMPESSEVALQYAAEARGAGIFACDAWKVHTAWPAGTFDTPEGVFSANVGVFIHIWKEVFVDQIYKSYDWLVKVDPDTVFLPQRLRERLWAFEVIAHEAVYFKNTWTSFGFLGPIEILSQAAVLRLASIDLTVCPAIDTEGEDGWLHDCMEDHAGIDARQDGNILYGGCQVDACGDSTYVAYHAYKDPDSWNSCADRLR